MNASFFPIYSIRFNTFTLYDVYLSYIGKKVNFNSIIKVEHIKYDHS